MSRDPNEPRRAVTVARYGARCAGTGKGHSVAVYTTSVYVARPRQKDGVYTWRMVSRVDHHATSGRGVSAPMIRRAVEYATDRGWEFLAAIRHGDPA